MASATGGAKRPVLCSSLSSGGTYPRPEPKEALMTDRATALASLQSDAIAAIASVARVAAMRQDLTKVAGPSASAALSTLAVRAFFAGQSDAIVEAVKASADWSKAKSTWNQSVALAKYLRDGNLVPQGSRAEPFTIGGQAVKTLSGEHIEALAFPTDGDTTLPAIVKHTKTIKGARRTAHAEAEAKTAETLAAFLRSPEGAAYEGETPDTLLPRLMVAPAEFARVMAIGEAVLKAEAAAEAVAAEASDAETYALQVLEFVETCGVNVFALIAEAVAKRQAPAEAIAA